MGDIQELKGIYREYDGTIALRGIDLRVRKGGILTLVGPNGAGKTSLLRIMALIDKPTRGTVRYNGVEVTNAYHEHIRNKITMVFQGAVLFSGTVYENVAYGLKLRGYDENETKRAVKEALKLVRMGGYERRPAKRLSGGEQQRVALARALVLKPELLLLDEPTANLDPPNIALIERVIEGLRGKTTVVIATHNLLQARRLSHTIACLFNGTLLDVGKPKRVFGRPKNTKTRKFLRGELF